MLFMSLSFMIYIFDGFQLAPCLNRLHAAQFDEPEFSLKMLSKLSLIISMAASISPQKMKKGTEI